MTDPTPADRSLLFAELTRDQLAAAAPTTTLVVPLGATEQHGHHLPVQTDAVIVEALTRRAVSRASGQVPVLVAPTLAYGCSHHHLPFGGTMSVTTTTYIALICDLVTGLAQEGWRSVVLLNGHGGNDAAIRVAVDRLTNEIRCGASVAATSYWITTAAMGSSLTEPGHAGHFETSAMLELAPELVDLSLRPNDPESRTALGRPDVKGAKIGRPGLWEISDGRTDDARTASADAGAAMVDEISAALAEFLIAFHRSTFG